MNTQQAYINGFVKRAGEYGFTREEALKLAGMAEDAGLDMKDLGLGGNEFSAKPTPVGIKINDQTAAPTPAVAPRKGLLSGIFNRTPATPVASIAK